MESNHRAYDFEASFSRIDAYLDSSNDLFQSADDIPARNKLTYSNGYYIENCTAMFVDIRRSSELPAKYTRPRLAKIYRAYISEVVAVMNGNPDCADVNIVGDAVSGIFNGRYKKQIDGAFETAGMVCSAVKTLNWKLIKRQIDPIRVGVGIDSGRVLMVQAGNSGSGLNEVVWMGRTVNDASNLCHYGSQTYLDRPVMLSAVIYENIKQEYKQLVEPNYSRNCYYADIVNSNMEAWYLAHCT